MNEKKLYIVSYGNVVDGDLLVKPIDKSIDKVALKIKAKIKGESDV